MNKKELINYINTYLNINNFSDSSKNWLQIDNSKDEVKKIWFAVDATTYIFNKVKKENVDLILVHHWLFWWFEQVLVWVPYKRAKIMLENDIALAWYHLPLDAHAEVGNNAWLLNAFVDVFDLEDYFKEEIIEYKWENIGFWIKFEKEISLNDIRKKYLTEAWLTDETYIFWKDKIKSVAFCSWWAWSEVKEANELWYDLYITWEAVHHEKTFAKEMNQSVIYWWHYETEKFWVKLLSEHLKEKFGIEIIELDEKY